MPLKGNHVKLTTSACGAGAAEATRQWVPQIVIMVPTVYALPYKTKRNVPSSISKDFREKAQVNMENNGKGFREF